MAVLDDIFHFVSSLFFFNPFTLCCLINGGSLVDDHVKSGTLSQSFTFSSDFFESLEF